MDRYRTFLRGAPRLALFLGFFALAFAGLIAGNTSALAEFEIEESGVEKGEVELEYRGAVHDGFPRAEREEAEEEGEGGASRRRKKANSSGKVTTSNSQYGLTDRLMFSTTLGTDEPLEENFDLSAVEFELQYELIEREGNGLGLAFIGGLRHRHARRRGRRDRVRAHRRAGERQGAAHAQSLLQLTGRR